jgi:hypothetical protein
VRVPTDAGRARHLRQSSHRPGWRRAALPRVLPRRHRRRPRRLAPDRLDRAGGTCCSAGSPERRPAPGAGAGGPAHTRRRPPRREPTSSLGRCSGGIGVLSSSSRLEPQPPLADVDQLVGRLL